MKLIGKNVVIERLRANPSSVLRVYVEEQNDSLADIRKKAQQARIPVVSVSSMKIMKLAQGKNAQGVVCETGDFTYTPFDDLIEGARKNNRCPVFLDCLQDPQNLGALLRSLACLGKFSVVLPQHDSVSVTETVLKIASGGENYVPIARVVNLVNAIKEAKEMGFWIVGTMVGEGDDLMKTTFPHPVALVIGSEEKGIRVNTRKHVDVMVTIPMSIETISFNAAHAATIVCYEITKQKKLYKEKITGER